MVFENYAEFYDLYYKDKDYKSEIEFVLDFAAKYGVKPASYLDMGCGTGRHMEQFLAKGLAADGFDLSANMLKSAEKRLAGYQNVNLSEGNLCSFRNGRKYPLVVSLFAVMGYLTSNEDLLAGLKTAAEHLEDGGVFIFDGWFGPAVLSEKPEERTHKYVSDDVTVYRHASPELDAEKQCVTVNYEITLERAGKKERSFKESHRMRMMFAQEMELAMNAAGLKMLGKSPWMQPDAKLGTDTWNICFAAGKKI